MSKTEIISRSSKETQKIAELFVKEASRLNPGRSLVVALEGQLGSGKTTFSQGLAKALGVKEKVLSPTFVLVKIYPVSEKRRVSLAKKSNFYKNKFLRKYQPMFFTNGVYPLKKVKRFRHLIHIDCYRLQKAKDILHLGFKNFLQDQDAIVVIEWASRIKSILPKDTVWLRFKHGPKSGIRILHT